MYEIGAYISRLKLARRSEKTIALYDHTLRHFAAFLGVDPKDLHTHLEPENLINYAAAHQEKLADRTLRVRLNIIHNFYKHNGVQLNELDLKVVRSQRGEEQDDKPLSTETLQKMMDHADTHAKAILSVLISTGMRAGECCKLTLDNLNGDTITIPNKIAKGGHGGKVYLTKEAQDYLEAWLKVRAAYLTRARTKNYSQNIPKDDKRLFCVAYPTMRRIFSRLYDIVDGERGRYWSRCTIHSCRKYFRTHSTMPLDFTEKILRHSGYLTNSYVRITDEETLRVFHVNEASLYITRIDHRIQSGRLAAQEREIAELKTQMAKISESDALLRRLTENPDTMAIIQDLLMRGKIPKKR